MDQRWIGACLTCSTAAQVRLDREAGAGILAEGGPAVATPVGAYLAGAGLAEACLVGACLGVACLVVACFRSPAASCLVGACPAAGDFVGLEEHNLVAWSVEGNLPSEPLPCWVGERALVPEHRWLRRLDVRHIQDKTWSHPEWILHTLRTAWCNLSPAPPTRFLKASSALLGNKATCGLERNQRNLSPAALHLGAP